MALIKNGLVWLGFVTYRSYVSKLTDILIAVILIAILIAVVAAFNALLQLRFSIPASHSRFVILQMQKAPTTTLSPWVLMGQNYRRRYRILVILILPFDVCQFNTHEHQFDINVKIINILTCISCQILCVKLYCNMVIQHSTNRNNL
jgi:hypothetical protein